MLALILLGFTAFVAMLYFIGAGDTGDRSRGGAHAAADGLNGYSGLVKLLELEDFKVSKSRRFDGVETSELLVITPTRFADADAIGDILEDRQFRGPTLIILPKWFAMGFPNTVPDEIAETLEDDWVRLFGARRTEWTEDLPEPYAIELERRGSHRTPGVLPINLEPTVESEDESESLEALEPAEPARWNGFGLAGELPTPATIFANPSARFQPLVVDQSNGVLALVFQNGDDAVEDNYHTRHPVFVIVDPDLVNNFGLSDPIRAAAALELFDRASADEAYAVTFDLTLNGLGQTTNLLTLAFRPPFLAATLCLLVAMFMIGWRAFKWFGPPLAAGPQIAFGKHRLVANGSNLIVRAKRFGLLAEPYAVLSRRRIAKLLGLSRPDPDAIDDALARRLGQSSIFSGLAANLLGANTPTEILRAARALKELEGTLQR